MFMTPLYYLASPYNPVSKDLTFGQQRALRRERYIQVCNKAGELMCQGHNIFCPIAHSHAIEIDGRNTGDTSAEFWLKQDFAVLQHCNKLLVYKMPDWEKSYGIAEEIKFAERHGIPIEYLEFE
jgi:hypothetical protein